MSVSILNALAVMPSGKLGAALSLDELSGYLAKNYNTDTERDRNRRHALRDELYRDGGVTFMKGVIDQVFVDPLVRDLRKRMVEYARFNNPTKRIVNECSTVYAEPAERTIDDGLDVYKQVLDNVRMDEQMLQIGRLLNLHRALLVGFRVRQRIGGTREPVLDVATPANVRAVTHPNDDTEVIAWLIKTAYKTCRPGDDKPAWTLWSDFESIQLREDLSVIGPSYQEHGLGINPWVPIALGPPHPGFWPGHEGEDLVAGHIAVWLTNILLLKETKSATKQTVLSGDGTQMARGQAMDSEVPLEITDGQSATAIDMSMDLGAFQGTADHVLQHLAQNYGMSPALINHQGVQSAEARELMRIPLKELRKQQQIPFRRFEKQLANVMAKVLAVDLPALSFDASSWRIRFGEAQTPLSQADEQNLFESRRSASLANTVDEYIRLNPDATVDQAMLAIERNIVVETWRNEKMRPLMAIGGAVATAPVIVPGEEKTGGSAAAQ